MEWIRVEGESMSPFLRPGDWISVTWENGARSPDRFRDGELVLSRSADGAWIVHRVVLRRGELRTKGDSAFCWDAADGAFPWGRVSGIRFDGAERAREFRPGTMDRWIAALSGRAIPPEKLRARVARKLARWLGAFRREALRRRLG